MAYGNFKSLGRASRRGHVAEYKTKFLGTVLLRPVKSDKLKNVNRHRGGGSVRHFKGAYWPAAGALKGLALVDDRQKLTHL